jgi:hypothetical protein
MWHMPSALNQWPDKVEILFGSTLKAIFSRNGHTNKLSKLVKAP